MKTTRIMAFALAFLGAACTNNDTVSSRSVQSQVLLTEPPEVCDAGIFGDWFWYIGAQDNVELLPRHTGESLVLDVPSQETLSAMTWVDTVTEDKYLFIGTIDASEKFSVFRLNDADGDGCPDESTATLLFDSGTRVVYGTHLARATDSTDLYVLDARCQDILVATDSDSDGWPDTLHQTPYAMADTYAELATVRMLIAKDAGKVDAPEFQFAAQKASHLVRAFRGRFLGFADTDDDNVANTMDTYHLADPTPGIYGRPYDTQATVKLKGKEGEVAEVWIRNLDHENVTLLGSVTLGPDWTTLNLSAALEEGQFIGVNYSDTPEESLVSHVWKTWPHIVGTDEYSVDVVGDSLTISGQNFTATSVVVLTTNGGETERTLTVTLVDSETLTVTIPALEASDLGGASITVTEPGQDAEEDGASSRLIHVLDFAALGGN